MRSVHRKIRHWYTRHGRTDLPWRNTADPYTIWLSEVMLQQTQVKTVLERYYFPFLEKFPSIEALGKAPLDAVLKQWEGLGYYTRAKNLHKTAQLLTQEQAPGTAPVLPSAIDALIQLPGIGKNTAHAVAAFAFRQPVPVMEANVRRILCRIYAMEQADEKMLWKIAYEMVDREHPFEYNQAMMDIGATLCTPKTPQCTACPFESICQGKHDPQRYPTKKRRAVPTREQHIMLNLYDNKLALTKREGKFLHGLWGFPATEVPLCAAEYIGEVTHAYTHFKLTCKVYLYDALEKTEDHYFTPQQIRRLAISKVDEKILNLYLDSMK